MTSISAASNSAFYSPLQKLQQELQSEVSAGTVSSSDQAALSSALKEINSSLAGGQGSSQFGIGQSTSPGDLQSKIKDLISKEVSNGKLTSSQATELQKLFSNTFAAGQGGTQGAGGPPPGMPPGPPPSEGQGSSTGGSSIADLLSSDNTSSTSNSPSTDGSSSKSTTSDVSKILKDFLKLLQESQSSATTYGASGSTSASLSALLVNYQT